jgi:hypothetical protein
VATTVCLLSVAWWQFGVTVYRLGDRTAVEQRVLGRVTAIHVLAGLAERERFLFPWSEPFEHGDPLTECAAILPEHWLDLNSDGRWDTWLKRLGPDGAGRCSVQYLVDTDLDGRSDWTFVLRFSEYDKGTAMMKARRGF